MGVWWENGVGKRVVAHLSMGEWDHCSKGNRLSWNFLGKVFKIPWINADKPKNTRPFLEISGDK